MKQLKFMLAAATAIGLASAAQAGYLSGSTDFEGNFDLAKEFTYSGTAGDNESAIVPGVPSNTVNGVLTELAEANRPANHGFDAARAHILQVNTGTTPILRSVTGSDATQSLANGNVYIDTLVKFTVTPDGDTPEASAEDKLMIYLKETKSGDTTSTNLVVQAASYTAGGGMFGGEPVFEQKPVSVSAGELSINPDDWYRLTVNVYADALNFTVFEVSINGIKLVSEEPMYAGDATNTKFPSLLAKSEYDAKSVSALSSVGFAGEGEVDDLVISTFNPEKTVVDFTLALADVPDGMGNVTYETPIENGTLDAEAKTVYCYSDNCTVTVDYTPVENYTATWSATGDGATAPTSNTFAPVKGAAYTLTFAYVAPTPVDFTYTFTLGENVSSVTYTIGDATPVTIEKTTTVEKIAKDSVIVVTAEAKDWYKIDAGVGKYTVTENKIIEITATDATSSDIVVPVPGNTDSDTVNSILAWAKAAGKTTTQVAEATTLMANYLLDVRELDVKPQIEIVSIDASTKPMTITAKVTDANGTTYQKIIIGEDAADINATIKYKAAATLEALKNAAAKDAIGEDDKFVQVVVE